MSFERLFCLPLSVQEVIDDLELNDNYVAVHGVFFLGKGCTNDDFLLLPKEGPFDGVGPIPMPISLDPAKCLLVDQPDILAKVGTSSAAGEYYWKNDCVIVGQIRHCPGTDHPYRIGNLWLLILQDWLDFGRGRPFHEMRLIMFSNANTIELPWDGPRTKKRGPGLIRVDGPCTSNR